VRIALLDGAEHTRHIGHLSYRRASGSGRQRWCGASAYSD
jgi:hypothetical protein